MCADPNNLPFSNEKGEGFENELARLVGQELDQPVQYTWWAQRRGFFRSTLKDSLCDVVMGVPSSLEMVRRTKPYYRSSYVFVTRRDRHLGLRSLDDTVLRHLKKKGPLTQRQADRLYGIGRLAARVHEISEPIEREMIRVRKANGEETRVARYSLA